MGHRNKTTLAILLLGTAGSAYAQAGNSGNVNLADNSEVLQAWQSASGGEMPELAQDPEGGTRIEWHGGITLDKYETNATGGNTLTPLRQGNFYKAQVQGDVRGTNQEGEVSYAQFSATNTDDRAALSHATQINSLQFGRMGKGYQVALGDVAASFSALGASLGLRGILAQKQFGQTTLAGTAGVIAESWESLVRSVPRTKLVRDVAAAKLETPVSASTRVFGTVQGYSDEKGSLATGISALAPAAASSATVGFAMQQERFSLQGEAGGSHWSEEGQLGHNDNAVVLDASWGFDKGFLSAGHHKIGKYYGSLGGGAGVGVKETYLNGNWNAASWITLGADARHSQNDMAGTPPPVTIPPTPPSTPNAAKTDSLATNASINFGPSLPGWNLLLNQMLSKGWNADNSTNRNSSYGANLVYAGQEWNSGLGYTRSRLTNNAAAASNSQTTGWTFNLGKLLTDASATWTASANFLAAHQEQKLDAGGSTRSTNWNLGLTGQRSGWGSLTASYQAGVTSQTVGGPDLRQKGYLVDATHPFQGTNASIKLYLRSNHTYGAPGLGYNEKTAGLQLVYQL
ncbi:MAG TPA: hypothetical protein VFK88_00505 [Gallionella sp.]|nr:hypothetical protein [Gallionella sp.]